MCDWVNDLKTNNWHNGKRRKREDVYNLRDWGESMREENGEREGIIRK